MEKTALQKIIEQTLFVDVEMIQPEPLLTISGKTILTENNFITISGLPKSRKTTFMQFFIASALTGQNFLGVESNLKKDDEIVLIDTEQSIFDFYRQHKYLKKAIGKSKKKCKFSAHLFREYEPDIILNSILEIAEQKKPKLIFIDNLTELAMNPNDIAEAKKIIQFLKKLTAKYNCGVVCLLHLSKSNSFSLGNLGSYADRGAQSILKVAIDKETDISTLDCTMLRSDAHFEPISIAYDKAEGKYVGAEYTAPEPIKKGKFSMANYTDAEITTRLEIVFDEMQSECVYAEFVEQLKKVFGVGNNAIKQVVIPYILSRKFVKSKAGVYTFYKSKK